MPVSKGLGKVVACIAAYNEEDTIAKVLVRASRYVDSLVVVDDGSEDDTALIAEKLGAVVIRHTQNLGKGVALRDCFRFGKDSQVGVLVTLDADGQHDPDEIPRLIAPVQSGEADIVVGSRFEKPEGMTHVRRGAQKALDALVGVKEDDKMIDSQSGFRAYSKAAIVGLEITEWGMGAESEVLMNAKNTGLKIQQVPVHMRYEGARVSHRSPLVQFTDVVSTIAKVSLSRRPLRTMGVPGMVLLLVGLYGWLDVLLTFNLVHEFALGHALVYTIVLLSGIFTIIAGILLSALRMAIQQVR
jgi:glycosyltransferase involved in cell wall biosynthesis